MRTVHWHALFTVPHGEKLVRQHLQGRGIEAFVPLLEKVSRWKGGSKHVEWALFRGYCFARFTMFDEPAVLRTPGVRGVLRRSAQCTDPLRDEDIVTLKTVVASGRPYRRHSFPAAGVEVRIDRGPLAGVRGVLQRLGPHTHVVIAISAIREAVAVTVDATEVVPNR